MKAEACLPSSRRCAMPGRAGPRRPGRADLAQEGLSKNQLAAHLSETGIAYRHLLGLGTPKAGREAARSGDHETFEEIFRAHMEEPDALLDLSEAMTLAAEIPACLLCFERDPKDCHRLIVADRMTAEAGFQIVHLFAEA